ncbi:MAG: phosphatase PAP2 family protein [Ignavibacteriaceae bacterium]
MYNKANCFILLVTIYILYQSPAYTKEKSSITPETKYIAGDSLYNESILIQKKDLRWHQMLTDVPRDYYQLLKKTFSFKRLPDLFNISLITSSLLLIDQSGWKYQRSLFNKAKFDRNFSGIAIGMGNGEYQFLTSALFASAGIIFHDKTALKTGSNIAEAVLSTGLLVQMLKRITGRESPYASSEAGGDWLFMPSIKEYQKNQPKYYSFPSGHLSTATAVVTVIANNYPDLKWIKPVGYSLLGLLSFSLVNEGMHWYSDFPLAFCIGYSLGNIIAPPENSASHSMNTPNSHLFIAPSYSSNKISLNAVLSF